MGKQKQIKERIHILEKTILALNVGRGSLYKNFFNYYLSEHQDSPLSNTDILHITGLKREVFLNALLFRYYAKEITPNVCEDIKTIIEIYSKTGLSNVEMELIAILMLLVPDFFDINIFNKLEPKIMMTVLKSSFEKTFTKEAIDSILEYLFTAEEIDFIDIAFSLIEADSLPPDSYNSLGKMFFNKMTVYRGHFDIRTYDPKFITDDHINRYHYLCCIFSLAVNEDQVKFETLIEIWKNLMFFCNDRNKVRSIFIDYDLWLNKWQSLHLDPKKINALLTMKLSDGLEKGFECKLGIFNSFCKNIVIMLLMSESEDKQQLLTQNKEALIHLLKTEKRTFLRWIVENSSSVIPFPDKKICINNIIHNDRLVLQKENELLIRYKSPLSPKDTLKDEFNYNEETEYGFDGEYQSITLPYDTLNFISLEEHMCQNVFFDFISHLNTARTNIESFKGKYFESAIPGYTSISKLDYYSKDLTRPLIPFTVFDPNLFDFNYDTRYPNNYFNFLHIMVKIIEGSDVNVFRRPYPFNFTAREFQKRLIFSEARNHSEKIFEYFEKHLNFKTCKNLDNPYEVEALKLGAIIDYHCGQKDKLDSAMLNTILIGYHDLYDQKQDDRFKLVFDIKDFSKLGKATSFVELSMAVIKSIHHFYTITDTSNVMRRLSDLLFTELLRIDEIVSQFLVGGRDDLKENYESFLYFDELKAFDGYETDKLFISENAKCEYLEIFEPTITINDTIQFNFDGQNSCSVTLLIVGSKDMEIQDLKLDHVNLILTSYCFLVSNDKKNQHLLLITPPSISRSYEAILARRSLFEKYENNLGHHRECYFDTYAHDKQLISSKEFSKAVKILNFHYQSRNLDKIEYDLINWLRMFNLDEQLALIEVISSHTCMTQANLDEFITRLDLYQINSDCIIATPKSSNDLGGIHRLLTEIGYTDIRTLALDNWVEKVITCDPTVTELVFLSDVMVSGSQALKALKYYLVTPHSITFAEKKKYHKITSKQSSAFINNLKNIRKITFYSAVCTEFAESNINEYLTGWFSKLDVPVPDIEITAALKIKYSEVVLDENKMISVQNQKIFKKIIAIDEIKKRFLFDETCPEDRYKDEYKTDTRNLVVRVMSVPKFAYKIFTLRPINTDVTPLFKYIKEHNPKA